MYKEQVVTIVTPAHNEARFIGQVIKAIPPFVDHLIVVDDCSDDDTAQAALACDDPRVIVLQTPSNQGVGGATILGYRKALELRSDLIVKMDGDGQMPAEYLSPLLDALTSDDYSYAKGNRFLAGESLTSMPKHRIFGNLLLTFLTKLASGYWHIFDPQNGFTAIKAKALHTLDLSKIHQRYFFENDMLINLKITGARAKDIPIPALYGDEESGINIFRVVITFPLLLLHRFFYRIYREYVLHDFSPIALFLFVGMSLCSWGILFGSYHWISNVFARVATPTGTVMLAVLPLIIGFQLILQAIVLDIQETPK
jgi:glycosyltransferase involved in cell wall biosynthesis